MYQYYSCFHSTDASKYITVYINTYFGDTTHQLRPPGISTVHIHKEIHTYNCTMALKLFWV